MLVCVCVSFVLCVQSEGIVMCACVCIFGFCNI